jgi:hypothetical protein
MHEETSPSGEKLPPVYDEDFVPDEEEDEDFEEEAPEEIDLSEWGKATHEDLDILRVPEAPQLVKVPIDYQKKLYIVLWIKELTITDQLRLMEDFFELDAGSRKKKRKTRIKFNLYDFYAKVWAKTVKKSEPRIKWQQAKRFGKAFYRILTDYMPNPFDMIGEGPEGLSELERKNFKQPSGEDPASP